MTMNQKRNVGILGAAVLVLLLVASVTGRGMTTTGGGMTTTGGGMTTTDGGMMGGMGTMMGGGMLGGGVAGMLVMLLFWAMVIALLVTVFTALFNQRQQP